MGAYGVHLEYIKTRVPGYALWTLPEWCWADMTDSRPDPRLRTNKAFSTCP